MRISLAGPICALLGVILSSANGQPASDPEITRCIDSYQPAWNPPEHELDGLVVAIEEEGGAATDSERRRNDDRCLWTASHLYHLVRDAGGVPVLNRPDDRKPIGLFDRQAADVVVTITNGWTGFEFHIPPDGHAEQMEASSPLSSASSDGVPAHRRRAEGVYRDLVIHLRQVRPQARPAASQPAPVPFYPKSAPDAALARAVAAVWPQGRLSAEKAPWFCELLARQMLSDRTHVYFEPTVAVEGGSVVISGATNHPMLAVTLEKALRMAGLADVHTRTRLLPEQGRLEPGRWFGVCVAPMALTFATPSEGGPLQNQLLYGEPVYLLDRVDGFYLLQGGDGYWGWVRENCIGLVDRPTFTTLLTSPQAVLLSDVEHAGGRIVRGSRLAVRGENDTVVSLWLPGGGTLSVARDRLRVVDETALSSPRAKTALRLLETPYLFGGRSSVGLDCSGLVGTVCDQHGMVLPRDAAQQFVTGRLVATRWYRDALRTGDRIYFISETGKIFHTGIALDGHHFVHSSPPAVQISSLCPDDRLYWEHWDQTFLGAKRP